MAEEIKYTDTKERIWKALKEAKQQLDAAKAGKVDFAADAKAKKDAQTVEKAAGVSAESIGVQIANLQKDVQAHFASISTALNEKIGDLNAIEDAIVIKQKEMKDLLGIETQALDLAAIVTAKQNITKEMDANYSEKLVDFQTQLEDIKAQISSEKEAWNIELATARKQLREEQAKEKAEFEYGFERYKRQKNDELEDTLKAKVKKYREEGEVATKALAEREEGITKREKAVLEAEAHVRELEARVHNFPAQLESAISEAKEAGRKEVEKTAAIRANYMEKDHANEVAALKKQIDILETALNSEREAHSATHIKLEAANNRVQEIAINAVKSAAESKVVLHQQPGYTTLDGRK